MGLKVVAKDCTRTIHDNYIQKIVELLGPVILGAKPAELISFPFHEINAQEKLQKIEVFFSSCRRLSYRKFSFKGKSVKILFYNPTALNQVLKDTRNKTYLTGLGYPKGEPLEGYVNCLVDKMTDGNLPHEIGLFLGYPLKDVIGFMGHPSLKLTKTKGWRVYGDPRLSDIKYQSFLEAKDRIKKMLESMSPENILLSVS